jgi:hypothetical protein
MFGADLFGVVRIISVRILAAEIFLTLKIFAQLSGLERIGLETLCVASTAGMPAPLP